MRIRLLMASLVDKMLYALNMKVSEQSIHQEDIRRTALLGDGKTIHQQTLQARAFADEIGHRVQGGDPPSRWWN